MTRLETQRKVEITSGYDSKRAGNCDTLYMSIEASQHWNLQHLNVQTYRDLNWYVPNACTTYQLISGFHLSIDNLTILNWEVDNANVTYQLKSLSLSIDKSTISIVKYSTDNRSTNTSLWHDKLTFHPLTDIYPVKQRWIRGRTLNMAECLHRFHKWELCNWLQASWYIDSLYMIRGGWWCIRKMSHGCARARCVLRQFSRTFLCSFFLPARRWKRRCTDQYLLVLMQRSKSDGRVEKKDAFLIRYTWNGGSASTVLAGNKKMWRAPDRSEKGYSVVRVTRIFDVMQHDDVRAEWWKARLRDCPKDYVRK